MLRDDVMDILLRFLAWRNSMSAKVTGVFGDHFNKASCTRSEKSSSMEPRWFLKRLAKNGSKQHSLISQKHLRFVTTRIQVHAQVAQLC